MRKTHLPGFGGITIRPVAEGDGAALAGFYQDLSTRSDYFFRPYRDKSPEAMEHVVRQSLAGHEDGYVVLDPHGNVIGHVFFGDLSREAPHLGIGLAEEYQNSGLGTVLMQFLISVGRRKLERKAIGLSVMKTNTRAIQVYEKCGFRISGECTFRSRNDSYVMQLDLDPAAGPEEEAVEKFFECLLGTDLRGVSGGEIRFVGLDVRERQGREPGVDAPLSVFLRRGRCVVLAQHDILSRVKEVASQIQFPEEMFSEEVRDGLREVVSTGRTGPGEGGVPRAVWDSWFYCRRDNVRLHLGPPTRQLSSADGDVFAEPLRRSDPSSPASRITGARALFEGGEIASCALAFSPSGQPRAVARVMVGRGPEIEPTESHLAVLADLVLDMHRQGRTVIAQSEFDDMGRIQLYQMVGMRKYADLFSVRVP